MMSDVCVCFKTPASRRANAGVEWRRSDGVRRSDGGGEGRTVDGGDAIALSWVVEKETCW